VGYKKLSDEAEVSKVKKRILYVPWPTKEGGIEGQVGAPESEGKV